MLKNVIIIATVASFFAVVSCKKNEGVPQVRLDDKNMVLPQDEFGNVIVPKKVYKKGEYPQIEIENANFDFGTINQGDKVEHVFKFKNTGKNDLIVTNAQASCGCTVPEWTKDYIKPGGEGQIKIVFNSEGKSGEVTKTVTLTTNTEAGNELITFKTNILTKSKK
jgi:hypothetical protein